MPPAHQRLDGTLSSILAKDRLIVDFELVHKDRRPQLTLDKALIALLAEQLAFKGDHPPASAILALVKGKIGLRNQRVRISRIAGCRSNAHCGRQPHIASRQRFGAVERFEHPVS